MSEPQPTADYVLPHYNDLGAFHQAGGYVNFIHELVTENPSVDVDALKEGSQDAFLAMLGSLSIPPHIPAQDASSLRSDLIKLALDDMNDDRGGRYRKFWLSQKERRASKDHGKNTGSSVVESGSSKTVTSAAHSTTVPGAAAPEDPSTFQANAVADIGANKASANHKFFGSLTARPKDAHQISGSAEDSARRFFYREDNDGPSTSFSATHSTVAAEHLSSPLIGSLNPTGEPSSAKGMSNSNLTVRSKNHQQTFEGTDDHPDEFAALLLGLAEERRKVPDVHTDNNHIGGYVVNATEAQINYGDQGAEGSQMHFATNQDLEPVSDAHVFNGNFLWLEPDEGFDRENDRVRNCAVCQINDNSPDGDFEPCDECHNKNISYDEDADGNDYEEFMRDITMTKRTTTMTMFL